MSNRRSPLLAPAAVALLVLTACSLRPRPQIPTADVGDVITREQIEQTGARTMWQALQRTVKYTRFQESGMGTPERIRRRGSSSIVLQDDMPVLIDGVPLLDITLLASMRAGDIERIQVLNGVHATTYFGTNAGNGVILIVTRDPDVVRKDSMAR